MSFQVRFIPMFFIVVISCSDKSTDKSIQDFSSTLDGNEFNNPISDDYSIVCGVFFSVKEFDQWQKSYLVEAQNTVIYLRSVDDPNMVVVFEANQTLANAKDRVEDLMGDNFSKVAGVEGQPVAKYYNVKYYKPSKISDIHYLSFSFRIKDIEQLKIFSDSKFDQFVSLGLRPIGLGSDPLLPNEVYILLTVRDIDLIRSKSSSPGKLKTFLAELNLPTNTNMMYWAKP